MTDLCMGANDPRIHRIRQAGQSISVMLILKTVKWRWVTAAVQYSGAGGRDPLFLTANTFHFCKSTSGRFCRAEIGSFREMAKHFPS